MQLRCYMQIFLSLNATGSVATVSGLMQSMGILDWASTTMSPWSMKSFSELPFFPPIFEVNMDWHPQMLLPFSCWQEKKSHFPMHLQFDHERQALQWLLGGDQGHWGLRILSVRCNNEANSYHINVRFPLSINSISMSSRSFYTNPENG